MIYSCPGCKGNLVSVSILNKERFKGKTFNEIWQKAKHDHLPAWTYFGLWMILQVVLVRDQIAGIVNVSYLGHCEGILVGIILGIYVRIKKKQYGVKIDYYK